MFPLAGSTFPCPIETSGILLRIPDFPDIKMPSTVLFSCLFPHGLLVMVLAVVVGLVEVIS